jgi:hypothetical protein
VDKITERHTCVPPGDLAPKEIKRPRQTARTIQPYPGNEWGAPKTLTLLNPEMKSFIPVVIHSSATDGVADDVVFSCKYSV